MTDSESPSTKKTLLILSVSAGAGHMRAAEALRETAEIHFPTVEAVHLDLMTLASKAFRRFYADSYDYLVEHQPSLWKYLYESTDKPKKLSKIDGLRRAFEHFNIRKLRKTLKRIDPVAVVCTHFLPAQFLSYLIRKGKFNRPVYVVVTDFDVHALWIHKGLTGYFAAAEEVAWRMRDRGLPPESIHVTGIPVMPTFSRHLSREECANELDLDPKKRTLLLMAGAKGTNRVLRMAERLLDLEDEFQIAAIAGRNEKLLRSLVALAASHPDRLKPIGFTRTIERVMKACDLAITKPGGLITSECLAMELPMLLTSKIPGQEERNATYLLEHGSAMEAYDEGGLAYRVDRLLKDPRRLRAMTASARQIARPHAAREILEIVVREEEAYLET